MKKYRSLFVLIFSTLLINVYVLNAQEKETPLLEIGNQKYSLEEFNYIYDKNNAISKEPVSKEDYLDLFVNYKLKVIEARSQGLDTLPSFKKELSYYRNELAKPYLADKKEEEKVAREAYERMLEDVNVSHILIRVPKNPYPEDTLKAYNKIKEIRDKIINGADFEDMAVKYSEDPSVVKNKGNLGYITVFRTVYPFENAAYNTPVGEVSPIIRTSFGYHILKVNDRRKSPGEVKVAHIMKIVRRDATEEEKAKAKNEIDSIYNLLQNGADFKELARKYSDDRNTAPKGGELEWFGIGRMIPAFSDAAFAIPENGQYSKPVRSRVGWHIIYRIDKRGVKPYDELKDELIKKVKRGERQLAGRKATIERLKKEDNFRVNSKAVDFLKNSIADKNQQKEELLDKLEKYPEPLCYIGDTACYLSDFVEKHGRDVSFVPGASSIVIEKKLDTYFNNRIINYEKEHLEDKYPEFRYLVTEYYDGLLIFDISQKEVWNKASADTTGLKKFYDEHKENYYSPEKFTGDIFICKSKKAKKTVSKFVKDTITPEIIDSLKTLLGDDLRHESGVFEKGNNEEIDAMLWGQEDRQKGKKPKVCYFGKFEEKKEQKFEDVKGLVIADYQKYIEDKWIKELREKYKPVIHYDVLKKTE
ncbi:MAG: hypothetical protein GXO47_08100 [Chlorobi bacterium]|nr:hypothetical protein [Chlorobiota bacterium]